MPKKFTLTDPTRIMVTHATAHPFTTETRTGKVPWSIQVAAFDGSVNTLSRELFGYRFESIELTFWPMSDGQR